MGTVSVKWGIDGRLLALVPVSTLLTSGLLPYFDGVIRNADYADMGAVLDAIPVMLFGAVFLWPVSLPFALVSWALVWHVNWRFGVIEPIRAMVAGAFAGVGSVLGLTVMDATSGGLTTLNPLPLLLVSAASSGFVVAAVIYWRGWFSAEERIE